MHGQLQCGFCIHIGSGGTLPLRKPWKTVGQVTVPLACNYLFRFGFFRSALGTTAKIPH